MPIKKIRETINKISNRWDDGGEFRVGVDIRKKDPARKISPKNLEFTFGGGYASKYREDWDVDYYKRNKKKK